jgi:uncharacterized protein (UPF0332 family)
MTLDKSDKETLIHYRIEQAKNACDDADFLIQNDRLTSAVNRIYYAMFYMLSALALKHDYHTSKHKQLLGWFNKNFVKDGTLAPQYAKIVTEAFESRSESDYGVFVKFTKDDVVDMFVDMKDFITTIEQCIFPEP